MATQLLGPFVKHDPTLLGSFIKHDPIILGPAA